MSFPFLLQVFLLFPNSPSLFSNSWASFPSMKIIIQQTFCCIFFSDGAMRVDEVKLTRGVSSRPSNPKWVSFDFIYVNACFFKNLVYDTEQGGRHSRD